MSRRFRPVNAIMLLLVLAQSGILLAGITFPLQRRLATVRNKTSWERSALLSFGDQFTGYLEFLRATIPTDGLVVLPPRTVDETYGNTGIMQYFLFPREIVNCPAESVVEECVQTFSGPKTFFLSIAGFPAQGLIGSGQQALQFRDGLGVFYPLR